jgi:hypothetical protein
MQDLAIVLIKSQMLLEYLLLKVVVSVSKRIKDLKVDEEQEAMQGIVNYLTNLLVE